MFNHSFLITIITLLVLSTYFDSLSEAKCHRHRRRRNNCCCGCEKEEGEGTTTPENNVLSSVSGSNSPSTAPISSSAVNVQSPSTAGPSSIVLTSEGSTSVSVSVSVPSTSASKPSAIVSTSGATTTQSYVQTTTTKLKEATTTPNPRGTCTLFSNFEGSNPLGEECKQIMKRPCDPNCVVINLNGYFGNDLNGFLYKGCNPAIDPTPPDMDFRCNQMCNAANLNSCDPAFNSLNDMDCIDRCAKYCRVPNNTVDNPVPLFCD